MSIWRVKLGSKDVYDLDAGDLEKKYHSSSVVFIEHFLNSKCPPKFPPDLNVILEFVSKITTLLAANKTVICYAKLNCLTTSSAAVLVGSFLIISRNSRVDEVIERLSKIACPAKEFDGGITVRGCLMAIRRNKLLGILQAPLVSENAQTNNESKKSGAGRWYQFIVPGRLLLPTQRISESEKSNISPPIERYAAACARLGVCLVLRVGERERPAAGPDHFAIGFAARGIAVEDLPLGPGCLHMLRALDTLLAILRSAPGPVAVHADAAGLRAAEPLLAACLVTACGFAPGSAVAWLRMAHPAAGMAAGMAASRPGRCSTPGPAEWARVDSCAAGRLHGPCTLAEAGGAGGRDGPVCRGWIIPREGGGC